MVVVAVLLQPLASVMVTVYVVELAGLATGDWQFAQLKVVAGSQL
jgi:hypothetical protein